MASVLHLHNLNRPGVKQFFVPFRQLLYWLHCERLSLESAFSLVGDGLKPYLGRLSMRVYLLDAIDSGGSALLAVVPSARGVLAVDSWDGRTTSLRRFGENGLDTGDVVKSRALSIHTEHHFSAAGPPHHPEALGQLSWNWRLCPAVLQRELVERTRLSDREFQDAGEQRRSSRCRL